MSGRHLRILALLLVIAAVLAFFLLAMPDRAGAAALV